MCKITRENRRCLCVSILLLSSSLQGGGYMANVQVGSLPLLIHQVDIYISLCHQMKSNWHPRLSTCKFSLELPVFVGEWSGELGLPAAILCPELHCQGLAERRETTETYVEVFSGRDLRIAQDLRMSDRLVIGQSKRSYSYNTTQILQ